MHCPALQLQGHVRNLFYHKVALQSDAYAKAAQTKIHLLYIYYNEGVAASVLPMNLFMANKSPAKVLLLFLVPQGHTRTFHNCSDHFQCVEIHFRSCLQMWMNRHAVSFWSRSMTQLRARASVCDECGIHFLKICQNLCLELLCKCMYFLQGSTTEVAQDYRTFPWCFNWFMENVCPLFNPEWLKEQEKRKMKNNGTATWRKSHLIWYSNYNYSQLLGLIVSNKLLTSLYNGSFVNTCMPSMQLTPWPASHSDSTSIFTSISSVF